MAALATAPADIRPADSVQLRQGLPFPVLAAAYSRWSAEGSLPLILYRNPGMTLQEFLDWNYQDTVEPVGCFVGEQMVGVGWINQARRADGGVAAEVGAAFFKGTPRSAWRRSIEMLLDHAFVDRGFVSVYGLCASRNRAGSLFTRLCGMERVDRLPWPEDVGADICVYRLDRAAWAERSQYGRRD
jgi:hypothetical protein